MLKSRIRNEILWRALFLSAWLLFSQRLFANQPEQMSVAIDHREGGRGAGYRLEDSDVSAAERKREMTEALQKIIAQEHARNHQKETGTNSDMPSHEKPEAVDEPAQAENTESHDSVPAPSDQEGVNEAVENEKTIFGNVPFLTLRPEGTVRSKAAYRISDSKEWTKLKNQLILTGLGDVLDRVHFKASGRIYYDAVFDLTNTFPETAESDEEKAIELREAYLDYSLGPFDLRLGRQQVVWGEAFGLFFADVVNARDLREFVLIDFDLIRIPQWGLDLEYTKNNFYAELVWFPILEFNKLGVDGSEFGFSPPVPSGVPFLRVDPVDPKNNFENSEMGVRLSYLLEDWDFNLFYLHTWDQSPVFFRTIQSGAFLFSPKYKRLNVMGATFSKEMKGAVLKGEFVLNQNSHFPVFDVFDQDGILQRDFLNYMVGVDYKFWDRVDANFQFMQKAIFKHTDRLVNEEVIDNSVSLRLAADFFRKRLAPEFLIISNLAEMDLLLRPLLGVRLSDRWQLRLGADIFQGDSSGTFGAFDKKSFIYSEMIYHF